MASCRSTVPIQPVFFSAQLDLESFFKVIRIALRKKTKQFHCKSLYIKNVITYRPGES